MALSCVGSRCSYMVDYIDCFTFLTRPVVMNASEFCCLVWFANTGMKGFPGNKSLMTNLSVTICNKPRTHVLR